MRKFAAGLPFTLACTLASALAVSTGIVHRAAAQPIPVQTVTASQPSQNLKMTYGSESTTWTAATLAALPHITLTVHNEHIKADQTYSGVPLTLLLTKLGVPDKPHGKDFRLYLLAEGADGYGVVYSAAEVTPDVHEGTVIVADTLAGKPLAENGPFQLVAAGEKRPARWVRNLVSIRVVAAK